MTDLHVSQLRNSEKYHQYLQDKKLGKYQDIQLSQEDLDDLYSSDGEK